MKIHEMDSVQREIAWRKFKQMRSVHLEFSRELLNDLIAEALDPENDQADKE